MTALGDALIRGVISPYLVAMLVGTPLAMQLHFGWTKTDAKTATSVRALLKGAVRSLGETWHWPVLALAGLYLALFVNSGLSPTPEGLLIWAHVVVTIPFYAVQGGFAIAGLVGFLKWVWYARTVPREDWPPGFNAADIVKGVKIGLRPYTTIGLFSAMAWSASPIVFLIPPVFLALELGAAMYSTYEVKRTAKERDNRHTNIEPYRSLEFGAIEWRSKLNAPSEWGRT